MGHFYGHLIEEEINPHLVHTHSCTIFCRHPKVRSCSTPAPLCDGTEGRVAKENPQGGTLSREPGCFLRLEECVDSTEIRTLVLVIWLNDQGPGRNMIWKLMTRKKYANRSPKWAQHVESCTMWKLAGSSCHWYQSASFSSHPSSWQHRLTFTKANPPSARITLRSSNDTIPEGASKGSLVAGSLYGWLSYTIRLYLYHRREQCFALIRISICCKYKFAFLVHNAYAKTSMRRFTESIFCHHGIPHSTASKQRTCFIAMKQDNELKFEEFTGLTMFPISWSSWLDKPGNGLFKDSVMMPDGWHFVELR